MRELKFRAKSLDAELVYFSLHDVTNCFKADGIFYIGNVPCAIGTEEQYTGLKDKNGKEIYDGEILDGGLGRTGIARWQNLNAMWIVDWKHTADDKRMKPDYYAKPLYMDYLISKIIGDIFENPELVEGIVV